MARSRQLSDLRNDAYKLSDLESLTDRYPAAEVTRYLNQGVAECWDMLVLARGNSYYGKPFYSFGTVTRTGTSPTGVTITGAPRVGTATSFDIAITIVAGGALGTATFSVTFNGTTSATLTTGTSVSIPDLHLTLSFPSGTYVLNDTYTATATKSVTEAGRSAYALPVDFYKLHKLYLRYGAQVYELAPCGIADEAYLRSAEANMASTYLLRDGLVEILPAPNSALTIEMHYVPSAPILQADSDSFDGLNGFEDYPVQYAARKMLLKEGDIEMANMVTQDMNKTAARITKMSGERDQGTPARVQDVRGALPWKSTRVRRFPPA